MIARKGKAGSLRSRPNQHAVFHTEVGGRIELLARHNDADNGLLAIVLNLHIRLVERNLHTLVLDLVIDNGGFVDMSATDGSRLGLDDEEVLQGLRAVHRESEVGEVVSELHGFVVHAIHPTAQHGNLGSRIGALSIACIAEVFEGNGLLRLGGIQVLSDAAREQEFAAV